MNSPTKNISISNSDKILCIRINYAQVSTFCNAYRSSRYVDVSLILHLGLWQKSEAYKASKVQRF